MCAACAPGPIGRRLTRRTCAQEEGLRLQRFLVEEQQEAARGGGARKVSGGVDMGPDGAEWETFHIEGGLDLDGLEPDEMEESEEWGEDGENESGEGGVGELSEDEEGLEGGRGKVRGGVDMGPAGEGWETFTIDGGLDLDLDDDELEASEEWVREGEDGLSDEASQGFSGQTEFEYEARKRESKVAWFLGVDFC